MTAIAHNPSSCVKVVGPWDFWDDMDNAENTDEEGGAVNSPYIPRVSSVYPVESVDDQNWDSYGSDANEWYVTIPDEERGHYFQSKNIIGSIMPMIESSTRVYCYCNNSGLAVETPTLLIDDDVEPELEEVDTSANIAFGWSFDDLEEWIRFYTITTAKDYDDEEIARDNPHDWTYWGVPSTATISTVEILSVDRKVAEATDKLVAHSLSIKLVDGSNLDLHLGNLWEDTCPITEDSDWEQVDGEGEVAPYSAQLATDTVKLQITYNLTLDNDAGDPLEEVRLRNLILVIWYVDATSGHNGTIAVNAASDEIPWIVRDYEWETYRWTDAAGIRRVGVPVMGHLDMTPYSEHDAIEPYEGDWPRPPLPTVIGGASPKHQVLSDGMIKYEGHNDDIGAIPLVDEFTEEIIPTERLYKWTIESGTHFFGWDDPTYNYWQADGGWPPPDTDSEPETFDYLAVCYKAALVEYIAWPDDDYKIFVLAADAAQPTALASQSEWVAGVANPHHPIQEMEAGETYNAQVEVRVGSLAYDTNGFPIVTGETAFSLVREYTAMGYVFDNPADHTDYPDDTIQKWGRILSIPTRIDGFDASAGDNFNYILILTYGITTAFDTMDSFILIGYHGVFHTPQANACHTTLVVNGVNQYPDPDTPLVFALSFSPEAYEENFPEGTAATFDSDLRDFYPRWIAPRATPYGACVFERYPFDPNEVDADGLLYNNLFQWELRYFGDYTWQLRSRWPYAPRASGLLTFSDPTLDGEATISAVGGGDCDIWISDGPVSIIVTEADDEYERAIWDEDTRILTVRIAIDAGHDTLQDLLDVIHAGRDFRIVLSDPETDQTKPITVATEAEALAEDFVSGGGGPGIPGEWITGIFPFVQDASDTFIYAMNWRYRVEQIHSDAVPQYEDSGVGGEVIPGGINREGIPRLVRSYHYKWRITHDGTVVNPLGVGVHWSDRITATGDANEPPPAVGGHTYGSIKSSELPYCPDESEE